MGKPVMMVESVTLAMKGQRILQMKGIRSDIQRIHNPEGCSFGLRVREDHVDTAVEILSANRIEIIGMREGRD